MLVHSHEKMHIVAGEAPIARDGIRADLLERVAEMGIAVGVVDRRREEESGQLDLSCGSCLTAGERTLVSSWEWWVHFHRFPTRRAHGRRDCGAHRGVPD